MSQNAALCCNGLIKSKQLTLCCRTVVLLDYVVIKITLYVCDQTACPLPSDLGP